MIAPEGDKPKSKKTKGTGRRGRPKKVQTEGEPAAKTGRRGRPKKEKPETEAVEVPVKTIKRGRPKKVQAEATPAAQGIEAPKKKRGRPSLAKVAAEEALPTEPKKRGRKKLEKPVVEEKPKRGRKAAVKLENAAEKTVVKKEKKVKSEKKVKKAKEVKERKQRVDKEITEEMVQEKLGLYTTSDTNLSLVMSKLFSLKKVARPKFEAKLIDFIKRETLEDDTVAEGIVTQLQEMQVLDSTGTGGRVFYKD
jgi:hypothetical protein